MSKHKKPHNTNNRKKDRTEKQAVSEGIVSVNSRGIGYVDVPGFEDDLEIQERSLNTALHGDTVTVKPLPKVKDKRAQGEVISIVKRAKTTFVGILEKSENFAFLVPDDRRMYRDIFIPSSHFNKAKDGQKVLVKMTKWDSSKKNPTGEVVTVLGKKGEHNVEMQSIVLERGFEIDFPDNVEKEAQRIAKEVDSKRGAEDKKRRDYRDVPTFTIDPADAKDFDDALSIKETDDGLYEIGVHIADVSHFVEEGSALDKEAKKRGTSVYLVDRTIPMLPEILSNDLCSLNPNEDKYAFSAIFTMDKSGAVKKHWFGKTIINSDKRFAYEDAQKSINEPDGEFHKELQTLNGIAKELRKEKFKTGAIDFESEEIEFELDDAGVPINIIKKERLDAHKLIEEYMLLANKEVAKFIYKKDKETSEKMSFIYRIHEKPDEEKIADLSVFLRSMGYELNLKDGGITSKDINAILKKVEGKAEESLVKTAAIRSMSKAIYSTKNIGHFGLAFQYYTHFTSPIRRYPDLLVHRLLFRYLEGGKVKKDDFAHYKKLAADASQKEVRAAEAERESIKYKQVEFMKNHVGEEFNGVISGITEWGIYVEEENTKADGMVRLKDMNDDFYTLDQKNYAIVGQKTKKKYSLGDRVKVKLTGADLDAKNLDFVFVEQKD